MNFLRLVICLFFVSLCALSQEVASDAISVKNRPEFKSDTLSSKTLKAFFKKDSTNKFISTLGKAFGVKDYKPEEKPRVALVRSLFFPGWGQITNKDYWKAGIVYAAAGAGWYYGIRANQQQYKKYLGHYSKAVFVGRGQAFFSDKDFADPTNIVPRTSQLYASAHDKYKTFYLRTPDEKFYTLSEHAIGKGKNEFRYYLAEDAEITEADVAGAFNVQTFESAKNQYRRWRDASYIGFAAGWLFFALEANVAAHLKTFDMSEDISMKISPAGPATFGTQASGVKLAIVFK
jgi:hypothetical protein